MNAARGSRQANESLSGGAEASGGSSGSQWHALSGANNRSPRDGSGVGTVTAGRHLLLGLSRFE